MHDHRPRLISSSLYLALFRRDVGRVSSKRLEVDRFHFSVEIPTNWTTINEEDFVRIIASVEVNGTAISPVFGIAKYPLGTSDNNANIVALTVKVDVGKDLCANLLASRDSDPSVKYHGGCREVTFNGASFGMQESTMSVASRTIRQTHYIYMTDDGHLIFFTLSYSDSNDKNVVDGIMRSISFST